MNVRLTGDISGTRNGQEWPKRGGEIDLPEDEAKQLVSNGMAEVVVETATAPAQAVEKRPAPEARRPTQPVRGARK